MNEFCGFLWFILTSPTFIAIRVFPVTITNFYSHKFGFYGFIAIKIFELAGKKLSLQL
jgi:hypothetical protein